MTTIKAIFEQEDIGEKYDRVGAVLTTPYVFKLIEQSGIKSDSEKELKILDVGTGTGALVFELCKLSSKWKILATDYSEQMVAFTKKKVERNNLQHQVETKTADAMNLVDIADNSVDYLFGNFVYMLADPKKAFHEIQRVLRPGGKAAFSAWVSQDYFKHYPDICKKHAKAVPPIHVAYKLANAEEVRKMLEETGLSKVQITQGQSQWVEEPEKAVTMMLDYNRGIFETEEKFQAAHKDLTELVKEDYKHHEDKKTHFVSVANIVVVEK